MDFDAAQDKTRRTAHSDALNRAYAQAWTPAKGSAAALVAAQGGPVLSAVGNKHRRCRCGSKMRYSLWQCEECWGRALLYRSKKVDDALAKAVAKP